ncbi:MAG: HAD family phosphatase [Elusimicrobia bacterium]|nr:HAD family phosphatase [Elusimicrobiota bacterium]
MKAVLLDNDGVLADTEGLYFRACRDTLREEGLDLTLEEFQDVSLRQGRSTIDLKAGASRPPAELLKLKRRRDERYLDLIVREGRAREGAAELLEGLYGRAALAVVTASPRVHFEAMHRRTGFLRRFEFTLTQEDCPASKPSPAPYLQALRRGDWKAEECVVVEDTVRGLASARAAGIRCYAVPYGPSVGGDFTGAEAVLPDLAALRDALLALL